MRRVPHSHDSIDPEATPADALDDRSSDEESDYEVRNNEDLY